MGQHFGRESNQSVLPSLLHPWHQWFYFYGAFLMIDIEWIFNHIMDPLLTPTEFYSEHIQHFLLLTITGSPVPLGHTKSVTPSQFLALFGHLQLLGTFIKKYDERVLACWQQACFCTGGPWVCDAHTRPSKIASSGLCSFVSAFIASRELPLDFKPSLDYCHVPPPLSKQLQIESIILCYREVAFVSQDPLKAEGGNGDYFFITMLLNISRLECSWLIMTFCYSAKKGHSFLASLFRIIGSICLEKIFKHEGYLIPWEKNDWRGLQIPPSYNASLHHLKVLYFFAEYTYFFFFSLRPGYQIFESPSSKFRMFSFGIWICQDVLWQGLPFKERLHSWSISGSSEWNLSHLNVQPKCSLYS